MQGYPTEISEMIVLIREGKKEGFSLLYAKYAGAMYGIIYRVTNNKDVAENLLEATFVCICNHIDECAGEKRFFSWMIQIAQSVCREYIGEKGGAVCKDAMEMMFFGGYSYDETAKQMNVSADAVRAEVRNQIKAWR